MSENNIKNFINISSLGVYTKYVRVVDGNKYSKYFSENRVEFILELLQQRIEEL